MHQEILIFQNLEELNDFAAEKFVEIGAKALENHDRFTVALAGGSTPKRLYQLLSSDNFRNKIDWSKVLFFFGDERNVSPDSEDSNYRMANGNLFKRLQTDSKNIFPWKTEIQNASKTAEDYEKTIKEIFELKEKEFPRFDLILLGMGADGHTASLFPSTEALQETEKIAAANPVEKLQTTRLTLTFPVINNAANVMFLVAGEEKAETLKQILEGDFQPEKLPSQNVNPADGNLFWLLDEKAAKLLTNANG